MRTLLTFKQLANFFQNFISFSYIVPYNCISVQNCSITMDIQSAWWILMAWCFSTEASVATVLSFHAFPIVYGSVYAQAQNVGFTGFCALPVCWSVHLSMGTAYVCHLTHCGLVLPYGIKDLNQNWFRLWLVAWLHQAIICTSAGLLSIRQSGKFKPWYIFWSFTKMHLKLLHA